MSYHGEYTGQYQQQQPQQYQQQQQQYAQTGYDYYATTNYDQAHQHQQQHQQQQQQQYGGGGYSQQQQYQQPAAAASPSAVLLAPPSQQPGVLTNNGESLPIPPGWRTPYLPPELEEKAARELNETDQTRREALAAMRELVNKEKKIKFLRTDEFYLLAFLRCRKFNVKKAYKNLIAYTEFYNENKAILERTDVNRLRRVYETGFSRVCPGTDKHGRRVSLIIARNMAMEGTPTDIGEDMLRFNLLLLDYVLQDVYLQVNGIVVAETFEGFTFQQARQMHKQQDPKMMKKSMSLMQGVMPIRVQGIYLLNVPTYVSVLMRLAKFFMKKKMRDRIHVWGSDFTPLFEQIDPRELPPEFGGTLYEDPMAFWNNYERGLPISHFYRRGIMDERAPQPAPSQKNIVDTKMTREEEQVAAQMGVNLKEAEKEFAEPAPQAPGEWSNIDE